MGLQKRTDHPMSSTFVRRIKTLWQLSTGEAINIALHRILQRSNTQKPRDEFVAADTFGYVFQTGGHSRRMGNRNLIQLPNYRMRQDVRLLLRRHTTDFHVFNQVFRFQEYEPILSLAESAGICAPRIVDAGANVGCSPIWWICCFPDAQVLAIEPEARNFAMMEKNIELNKAALSIQPLRRALWHSNEMLAITNDFRDGREYAFSVRLEAKPQREAQGFTMPEVFVRQRWTAIDIMKVDIEGAEQSLFEDFAQAEINLQNVRILALEIHDDVANRAKIETNLQVLGFKLTHRHETVFAVRV